MRFVIFCHSLVSDWNHGNAHFLRGVTTELVERGHDVRVYEPADGWSMRNLVAEHGDAPLRAFHRTYRRIHSTEYDIASADFDALTDGADVVIVHEWNVPELVARLGRMRMRGAPFLLLFHDTHHRAATAPDEMAQYDLSGYDGVLAFGEVIRQLYLQRGWIQRAWTWHEAADTRVFRPVEDVERTGDLIWIGNWGDDERSAELRDFLIDPARELGLQTTVHGVRYPDAARALLRQSGIIYRGWLPNFEVPVAFGGHRVTVHVPRRPYVHALPGIPTIRPFEAMACGMPLISAPWNDAEGLFRPGTDYLVTRDGAEMRRHLRDVVNDDALAGSLRRNGLQTIRARHTCAHRVNELLKICESLMPRNRELVAQ